MSLTSLRFALNIEQQGFLRGMLGHQHVEPQGFTYRLTFYFGRFAPQKKSTKKKDSGITVYTYCTNPVLPLENAE